MHGFERLTLANLGGGGAEELFQRELAKVLANLQDVNTMPTAKRKIVLTIDVKGQPTREGADVTVAIQTTLAKPIPTMTPIFLRNNLANHQPEAIQFRAQQVDLFAEQSTERGVMALHEDP